MNGRFRFNFVSFSFNTFIYDERFDPDFTFGNAGIRMLSSPSFGVYANYPLFMCDDDANLSTFIYQQMQSNRLEHTYKILLFHK